MFVCFVGVRFDGVLVFEYMVVKEDFVVFGDIWVMGI